MHPRHDRAVNTSVLLRHVLHDDELQIAEAVEEIERLLRGVMG